MEISQIIPAVKSDDQFYSHKLSGSVEANLLCPVRYIYDYLSYPIPWLKPQPVALDCIFEPLDNGPLCEVNRTKAKNSICLQAMGASLPLHTGLKNFRQTKHWIANAESTEELLQFFAQDRQCSEIILSDSRSLSDLAEEQLESNVIDTYSRFSMYMFPEADDKRIRLLAQCIILIFIFDDVWENASSETVAPFHPNLGSFVGTVPCTKMDTALGGRIDDIRRGLLGGDEEEGNGGAEVIENLIRFCYHVEPPREGFSSVREYLDYRWEDIANTADQTNAHIQRLLRHIGIHISIANDIASYEKEKQHFETGKATSMINVVHVIAMLERVEAQTAKPMAYAWQLSTENKILEELRSLKRQDVLSIEDWMFVDACLTAASGSLLSAVVMSRYGGEKTRVIHFETLYDHCN
ncbi:MAG: hypothetical protein Q9216_004351 [Gyalolechia sp. 2 TL-2023]